MSSDNEDLLKSRDQIREIAKKYCDQFGDEDTYKFFMIIAMESFHRLDSFSDKFLDFEGFIKEANEVAFYNTCGEEQNDAN